MIQMPGILGCNTRLVYPPSLVCEHLYQLLFILCISSFLCGHKISPVTQTWQQGLTRETIGREERMMMIFWQFSRQTRCEIFPFKHQHQFLPSIERKLPQPSLFPLNANLKKIQYGIFFIQFQFRFIKYDVSSEGAVMVIFNS